VSKKIVILIAIGIVGIIFGVISVDSIMNEKKPTRDTAIPDLFDIHITMSSSRPGCEKINDCYLPAEVTLIKGDAITWTNEDSAFHTVTSGYYDKPDGIFDSGYIDPDKKFSYTFKKEGEFHYYCRLHPWMEGKVIIKQV
jgi:plastocyanin